jgi:ABC-type polysaccharide/polyol phosphate export permease
LFSNLWRSRDILWYLIIRSLRSQYKKSALGYAWVFLNPLAQLLILSFVFSTILKTQGQQGVPFTLFLLVGLVPWIFFANCVMAATESISGGGSLITMVYFPREVLTASSVFARIIDLFAGLIILIVTMVVVGQPITIHVLWLFPFVLVQIMFTLGLVFPLAALNLYFHDVRFLVGVALNLWFFLTPIMYPRSIVPEKYAFVYDLNPMSRLVTSYRWALFEDVSPPLGSFFIAFLVSALFILVGYVIFKKMEPGFADNI